MRRANTQDGMYVIGNPLTGQKGSVPTFFFNDVQEELCAVIEEAGIELDGTRRNQLLAALQSGRLNFSDAVYAKSFDTLAEADAFALAAGKQLIISTVWNVVPATLSSDIWVIPGGQINNAGALTINGRFKGCFGCFRGLASGYITFGPGSVSEVEIEYWCGVAGDDTKGAINKAALLAAFYTFVPVRLRVGQYYCDAGLGLWGNNFVCRGGGFYKTELIFTTAVAQDVFVFGEDVVGHSVGSVLFEDLALIGNGTVGNGVVLGVNAAASNGYSVMNRFNRVRINGFSKNGCAAFCFNYTWWVNISNCLIDGNYHGFTVPDGAVTTTILLSDNTEVKSCLSDGINAGNGIIHDFTCRNISFEYCAGSVLRTAADKARFMFDKCYLEQNTTVAGVAQFEATSATAGRLNAMYLSLKECTSDVPLSGKGLNVDNVYLNVEDCGSFVSGTVVTTVNTFSRFIRMNGLTSSDFLAVAKTLLGDVYCEDYVITEGRMVTYHSTGNLFDNHLGVRGGAPAIAAGAAAGSGGSAVLLAGSTDTAGQAQVAFGGSGWVAGAVVRVTFAKPYNVAPIVLISTASTKANAQQAVNGLGVGVITTTYFEININAADNAAGAAYYNYQVLETRVV